MIYKVTHQKQQQSTINLVKPSLSYNSW